MSDPDTRDPAETQAADQEGVDSPDTPLAQPTEVQATRARMQGGGVGQREINAQRDPTRAVGRDQLSSTDEPEAR